MRQVFSHRSREGYFLVDHRFSPGLPPEVARAAGYDPSSTGEGKVYEQSTLTCAHCKTVVVKNPLRTRERASCVKCANHYVCDGCAIAMSAPGYDHMPYEKFVDLTLSGKNPVLPVTLMAPPQELKRYG